jgi:hypothetical protein
MSIAKRTSPKFFYLYIGYDFFATITPIHRYRVYMHRIRIPPVINPAVVVWEADRASVKGVKTAAAAPREDSI